MLTLRGHHLLCSAQYDGDGYSRAFVDNFDRVCAEMSAGHPVRLTLRPDSICGPMLSTPGFHCRHKHIMLRDLIAFISVSVATRRFLFPGRSVILSRDDLLRIRRAFQRGWVRASCARCEWYDHCGAITNPTRLSSQ